MKLQTQYTYSPTNARASGKCFLKNSTASSSVFKLENVSNLMKRAMLKVLSQFAVQSIKKSSRGHRWRCCGSNANCRQMVYSVSLVTYRTMDEVAMILHDYRYKSK